MQDGWNLTGYMYHPPTLKLTIRSVDLSLPYIFAADSEQGGFKSINGQPWPSEHMNVFFKLHYHKKASCYLPNGLVYNCTELIKYS